MKKSSFYLMGAILLTTFIITGCMQKKSPSELGLLTKQNIDERIHIGISTKHDIMLRFGMAHQIDTDEDGCETWTYSSTKTSAKPINFVPFVNLFYHGSNHAGKKLTIAFDKEGKVVKHGLDLTKDEVKAGIIPDLSR